MNLMMLLQELHTVIFDDELFTQCNQARNSTPLWSAHHYIQDVPKMTRWNLSLTFPERLAVETKNLVGLSR